MLYLVQVKNTLLKEVLKIIKKIRLKVDLWYSENKKGDILEVINFNDNGSCFVKKNEGSMFVEKKEFEVIEDEKH